MRNVCLKMVDAHGTHSPFLNISIYLSSIWDMPYQIDYCDNFKKFYYIVKKYEFTK